MLLSWIFQGNKRACECCSFPSIFLFVGENFTEDHFKGGIILLLKEKYRIKFTLSMALNNVRDNRKQQCKLTYKISKQTSGCDLLLDTYKFTTLIELTESIGGIHYCVTVVGKWIFYRNITFYLPLTHDYLDYCCTNDEESKGMNGYKVLLKSIVLFPTDKNNYFAH